MTSSFTVSDRLSVSAYMLPCIGYAKSCISAPLVEIRVRVRNWSAVFENRPFCRILIAVPLKMYTKTDFGWLNVKIGQKMASC